MYSFTSETCSKQAEETRNAQHTELSTSTLADVGKRRKEKKKTGWTGINGLGLFGWVCAFSEGGGKTSMRQGKGDEGAAWLTIGVYWFAEWSREQMRFAAAGSTTSSTYGTLL